jgi:hypothetical protein
MKFKRCPVDRCVFQRGTGANRIRIVLWVDDLLVTGKNIALDVFEKELAALYTITGHKGESIKKVGIQARAELEKFFGKHVFLEQFVKVEPDWRGKADKLRSFGYALD